MDPIPKNISDHDDGTPDIGGGHFESSSKYMVRERYGENCQFKCVPSIILQKHGKGFSAPRLKISYHEFVLPLELGSMHLWAKPLNNRAPSHIFASPTELLCEDMMTFEDSHHGTPLLTPPIAKIFISLFRRQLIGLQIQTGKDL